MFGGFGGTSSDIVLASFWGLGFLVFVPCFLLVSWWRAPQGFCVGGLLGFFLLPAPAGPGREDFFEEQQVRYSIFLSSFSALSARVSSLSLFLFLFLFLFLSLFLLLSFLHALLRWLMHGQVQRVHI